MQQSHQGGIETDAQLIMGIMDKAHAWILRKSFTARERDGFV